MTEEADFSDQIVDGKNKSNVRCQFCNSLMLKAQEGTFSAEEVEVPLMMQKQDRTADSLNSEPLKDFWLVKDMMTFENIGFSHTVDGRKFLVCADCERGPVGYHDLTTRHCFLALKRVVHKDS
ncbi:guanine nucleotide exchange factor MSS4 homolog [Drosophila takahashii]|uniref:guanine nucleotide exchange factor MSS4 homolog n=1 Tax=Drosophila takahashii TaxID=29030 RepID=UPI0007E858B5|nr:guanine nucleotide exchange factor MSS4 homolog [Drosophila takahashii]